MFNKDLKSCERLIRSICYKYNNERYSHDDMFQEMCIRIWKAYPNFNGKCKFSTYAYKIADNAAVDFVRKANKQRQIKYEKLDKINFKVANEEYCSIKEDNVESLYQAIEKLNQRDKNLILNLISGKSYSEISNIMGLKNKNINVMIYRAKQKLKEVLKKTEQ